LQTFSKGVVDERSQIGVHAAIIAAARPQAREDAACFAIAVSAANDHTLRPEGCLRLASAGIFQPFGKKLLIPCPVLRPVRD
jgi:hypothetical protein